MDAVILAGGLGTRLRSTIGDQLPKPLAEIRGRPFLDILIDYLRDQGTHRIIMCVSHGRHKIIEHCRQRHDVEFLFSEESVPMGTGGAIRQAAGLVQGDPFLAMNGDSLCRVDLGALRAFHARKSSPFSVVLAGSRGRADGGTVELGPDGRVKRFSEKSGVGTFISAGIYLVQAGLPREWVMPSPFSLELDVIPGLVATGRCFGFAVDSELTDIGTPQRYSDAQRNL